MSDYSTSHSDHSNDVSLNKSNTEDRTTSLTFEQTPLEQTLDRYFTSLNAGEFEATAALFAGNGVLIPPFESGITGQAAIVDYLNREAQDLFIVPLRKKMEPLDDTGSVCYKIIGTAQTALFRVNVGWDFVLSGAAEICSVEVKLLAALKELLMLKR